MPSDPRAEAIRRVAARIGADPVDLATVVSFETGGTFSPSIYGGKGGRHLGVIQFGPNEQKQFGVHPKQSFDEQLEKAGDFLVSRGFKPGMDRTQLYSTILAGNPQKQTISDTAAGGTPGGAAEKVRSQMAGHEAKARALFGDTAAAPPIRRPDGAPGPADVPTRPANVDQGLLAYAPFKLEEVVREKQQQQVHQQAVNQAQEQLAQAAQQPPMSEPTPLAMTPLSAQEPDFAALMLPRLRRGLLSDPRYAGGLLDGGS